MTFEQLWDALAAKKSALKDPEKKLEFVSKNLKALLKQVWDQSAKHEKETAERVRKMMPSGGEDLGLGGMFGDVFGRGGER